MNLEELLNKNLERTDPPDGFEDRVLERIRLSSEPSEVGSRSQLEPLRRYSYRGLAAAAAVFFLIGGFAGWQITEDIRTGTEEARVQQEGQQAKKQVMLALRITGEQMARAKKQLREVAEE